MLHKFSDYNRKYVKKLRFQFFPSHLSRPKNPEI